MTLSRRNFLLGTSAVVAAAAAAPVLAKTIPESTVTMRYLPLASIKTEGAAVAYDSISGLPLGRIRELLMPGVRKMVSNMDVSPDEWARVFAA